jgi:restriction endonuclease S subunit
LILVLPPIDEQRSILQHIDSTIKPYDLLVDNAKNEILALVEFKQILIAHTVTGKIKV